MKDLKAEMSLLKISNSQDNLRLEKHKNVQKVAIIQELSKRMYGERDQENEPVASSLIITNHHATP